MNFKTNTRDCNTCPTFVARARTPSRRDGSPQRRASTPGSHGQPCLDSFVRDVCITMTFLDEHITCF